MIEITDEFKLKVVEALKQAKENFDGWDVPFAHKYGMAPSIWSRLKSGEINGLLKDGKWMNLGRELGVNMNERKWNVARTEVFSIIEEDVNFCQQYSKARIYVDDCGIGKTFTAKYLSRNLKNCFYVDASQCKTRQSFVREMAKTLGVDYTAKYIDVKANIKYWLKMLPTPIIIVDEAGDLEYLAFLELKELWNATEGACGWYMMGADGLRKQIENGIANKKVGYRELFSRFSERYSSAVPNGNQERLAFYSKLISDVLSVNMDDKTNLPAIVKRCITKDGTTNRIGGLRRAESLLILNGE